MKGKNRVRPVRLEEIVGGQQYLTMGVNGYGYLTLDRCVFQGQVFHYEHLPSLRLCSKQTWKKTQDIPEMFKMFVILEDIGLVPSWDDEINYSRVFRFSMRNLAVLEDFIKNQRLQEYLTLIGVLDPEEVAAQLWDNFDSIDDGVTLET